MAAPVRVALRWAIVLAACQPGLAVAEVDTWVTRESGAPSLADAFALPTTACSACWGEYSGYTPAGSGGFGRTVWSNAPAAPVRQIWTADYRVRSMLDSFTSYEFGTVPGDPNGPYAPLSKLNFPLDSTWHGFQIGVELPGLRLHFEWLTPMQEQIDGDMADFDWNIYDPRNDPSRLDSLTLSSERWCDGQMLELGTEFKWSDSFFGCPVEFWPAGGFRFQRFDITACNLSYLVPAFGPIPELDGVDVITFNQQYYVGYFGGQLRKTSFLGRIAIDTILQVDGGPAAGYNIDHHLLREGDRFTIEETRGGAWHVGFMAEARFTRRLSVGFQADHMGIRTTGTHRLSNEALGDDFTWDNGVNVKSDQTTLTGFVRCRF